MLSNELSFKLSFIFSALPQTLKLENICSTAFSIPRAVSFNAVNCHGFPVNFKKFEFFVLSR